MANFVGRDERCMSSMPASIAELEWPLGKLVVRGTRSLWGRSVLDDGPLALEL